MMDAIARRLSVPELTQRILEMGKTGVYRESVLEALAPLATKKQIRQAIAHAKQFGLHSVASLRDPELGTYYQVDVVKYQSLASKLQDFVELADAAQLPTVVDQIQTVKRLLMIAQATAIGLMGLSLLSLAIGQSQLGFGLLSGALSAIGIWGIQRSLRGF